MIDFKALAAPFLPSAVSWRIGSVSGERGMALAYLDARDVMDRLDEVCGPDLWGCRYSHVGPITVCEIGICTDAHLDTWVWKADGAGQSDIEAEKGALSDAFKRAAVRWGIGRYLYSLPPNIWVDIEKRGNSKVIRDSEYPKLEAILAKASGPPQDAGTPPPRPTLPPADKDVEDAAKRWKRDAQLILANCNTTEEIKAWEAANAKALSKLKLQHFDLWDELMVNRDDALEAIRSPV